MYFSKIKSDLLPEMTKCCDKHDICYDTCGSDKEECDEEFKTCLNKMCQELKKKPVSKDSYSGIDL